MEYIASLYNCDIEIIDNTEKPEQQKFVEDFVQIITVFRCKLQGKRANKARKLVKERIGEDGKDGDKDDPGNVAAKQQTKDEIISICQYSQICLQLGIRKRTREL